MAKVTSLGHVGITVSDLDKMVDFYTNVLGMTVTDDIPGRGVFLSAQPESEHHEVVLGLGEKQSNAQQISLTVGSLDDVRDLYHAIQEYGTSQIRVTNHGIAIGCYFRDPEDNWIECYWSTGLDYPQPFSQPIDIDLSNEEILATIESLPPAPSLNSHLYGQDTGKRILN